MISYLWFIMSGVWLGKHVQANSKKAMMHSIIIITIYVGIVFRLLTGVQNTNGIYGTAE